MKLAVVILLIPFSQHLFSQTKTFTGTVNDQAGVPLIDLILKVHITDSYFLLIDRLLQKYQPITIF